MITITLTYQDEAEALGALQRLGEAAAVTRSGRPAEHPREEALTAPEEVHAPEAETVPAEDAAQGTPGKEAGPEPPTLEAMQAALQPVIRKNPEAVKEKLNAHGWARLSLIPEDKRRMFLQEVLSAS